MKTTVWICEFQDAFTNCWRGNSFSGKWFKALYEYLTQIEDDCGIELELDPVAFDCEYTEYESIEEVCKEYDRDEDYIRESTICIDFNGGIIVANF